MTEETDRRLALAQSITDRDGDDPPDCEACMGEAVAPDVLSAHAAVCEFVSHDIYDVGGGRCNTCGSHLEECPACGPYHGRQPPLDVWPRILTWTDEQVAEVETWLADSTAETPEVLRG
jgi:hypothetical protein